MNVGIFYIILSVPQNIVMDLNNVMLDTMKIDNVLHVLLLKLYMTMDTIWPLPSPILEFDESMFSQVEWVFAHEI